MGGTSTDVSKHDGDYDYTNETETAGVTIQSTQLDIVTVAAGGGSKLEFKMDLFKVGPESVGANPGSEKKLGDFLFLILHRGPACYRKGGDLAITDANLFLGRIIPGFFPKIFGPKENEPLSVDLSREGFERMKENEMKQSAYTTEEIAYGFIKVANESMCRPIRNLTEGRGLDSVHSLLPLFFSHISIIYRVNTHWLFLEVPVHNMPVLSLALWE